MSDSTAAIAAPLEEVLRQVVPGFCSLHHFAQLTAGASQETWRIEVVTDHGDRVLAMRRSQGAKSAAEALDLATEARLLQLAQQHGIPGPSVLHVLAPTDGLGEGFLMPWLEGETLGQRIVHGEQFEQVRPGLARRCGEILGRIHSVDWRAAGLAGQLPVVDPGELVEVTWGAYRDLELPEPMIDYCYRWLRQNLPQAPRQTLVHGDFRNGNLMVNPRGIEAVLDWELAHIGDPVRDLGWLCVNSWRFGRRELPVGGFGRIEDLLAGYRDSCGVEVSPQDLHFWQAFGSFWWAVTTLVMASAWRRGEVPSLERPVIGRRSSEAQMDAVNLLIPGAHSLPETAPGNQRLPRLDELLQAVSGFVAQSVVPQLEGRERFMARVAVNALGIAQREALLGPALDAGEWHRLQSLLGETGDLQALRWKLVERLRGDLPLDTPGLAQHLRQTVAGQLSIDQPGYSALAD